MYNENNTFSAENIVMFYDNLHTYKAENIVKMYR